MAPSNARHCHAHGRQLAPFLHGRAGEAADRRAAELASLRQALEMGWRVIDTAEMYGDGGAESLTGEALAGAQAGAHSVTCVGASGAGLRRACRYKTAPS